eukprot:UN25455
MRLSLILALVVGAILTAANPSQLRAPHEDNGRSRRGLDFDGFFDGIKKKVTEGWQKVKVTVKEFTFTQKVTMALNDATEEIEKSLGKLKEKVSDSDALKQIGDALAVAKSKITASVDQVKAKAESSEALNKALKELKDAKAKLTESIKKMQGMDSAD